MEHERPLPAPRKSASPARPRGVAPASELRRISGAVGNRVLGRALQARRLMRAVTLTEAARGPVRRDVLEELQTILDAAEAQGGAARLGAMLTSLETTMADPLVTPTLPGSRETFGMSGASFFPGVSTIGAQGSPAFVGATQGVAPGVQDLGQREVGLHDEMHHISAQPGAQAVLSTQRNCLFCYGVLEARKYQHGPLRDKPWPQKWTHDYLRFTLEQTSARLDAITTNPIVKIETSAWGAAYYVVS